MKEIVLIVLGICSLLLPGVAQTSFVEGCLGNWKGTMYLYNRGALKDSVSVKLTVAKTPDPGVWTWKTEYLSPTMPMVKDYTLRLKDPAKGLYITDEGEIELMDYLFGQKLYCVFETQGITLTSTYELRGKELIFEVTSGKIQTGDGLSVRNYSVDNLQRVVFRKVE